MGRVGLIVFALILIYNVIITSKHLKNVINHCFQANSVKHYWEYVKKAGSM